MSSPSYALEILSMPINYETFKTDKVLPEGQGHYVQARRIVAEQPGHLDQAYAFTLENPEESEKPINKWFIAWKGTEDFDTFVVKNTEAFGRFLFQLTGMILGKPPGPLDLTVSLLRERPTVSIINVPVHPLEAAKGPVVAITSIKRQEGDVHDLSDKIEALYQATLSHQPNNGVYWGFAHQNPEIRLPIMARNRAIIVSNWSSKNAHVEGAQISEAYKAAWEALSSECVITVEHVVRNSAAV